MASWYDVLQTGSHSDALRRYLELTLICAVDRRPERFERLDAMVPRLPDLPLLKYRVGTCDHWYQLQLRSLQREVPEFVDADFALGRYALRDARLGRVISLSNLERYDEAIASATALIDAGRWHLGRAFYWRAWNDFNIHNNEAARADADRTRTLMVNPAVFLLSGLIEWRLLRRETAETEFQEALKMDFGQCEAAFCLGGVRAELRKLPEAFDRSPFAARRSWPAASRASSVSGSVRQNSRNASEKPRVRRRRSAGGTVQWSAHAVPSDVGVNVDTFLKWDDCVLHFVHLLRTLHFALLTSC